ncbi:DNA replication/repair protein RecF [Candidatus Margulisiibacteriota bacterium]
MFLNNILLFQFRNYESQNISLEKEFVIVLGDNAQGKTSFLESIFLLSTAKSPREKKIEYLIQFGKPQAKVSAKISNGQKPYNIDIDLQGNKKLITINKNKLSKATDLLGFFNVVYLSPADIDLVKGEPYNRRRFLDLVNTQINKRYTQTLQDYKSYIKNRNSILRQENIDQTYLDVLDKKLAELGVKLISYRIDCINKVQPCFQQKIKEIINGEVLIEYLPGAPGNVNDYLRRLKGQFIRDKINGATSIGPHRDDFVIKVNGKDARLFASNGQQRALSIVLKLSEVDYLLSETGKKPVLLMDDVLLELDQTNLKKILDNLYQLDQIIITTTSLERLPQEVLDKSEIIEVNNGKLKKTQGKLLCGN